MGIATRLLAVLVLALPAAAGGPPHPSPPPAGRPRLVASPEDLPGLREKLAAPGSTSRRVFEAALAAVPPPGRLDFGAVMHATAPLAALFAPAEEQRRAMARRAIDSALALVREFDPPYPDEPEWIEWYRYRYLALTYDACHGEMTVAERAELRDELERVAALSAAFGIETTTNNHWTVTAVVLGLTALALEGDVLPLARRTEDLRVVRAALTPAGDFLPHRSAVKVLRAGRAAVSTHFVEGRDFDLKWIKESDAGIAIVWRPGGSAPAAGEPYFVTYEFTPDVERWKDLARIHLQRHLDHVWSDGASLAGVMYGCFALSWAVDLLEAFRRRGEVDFSSHFNLRGAPAWLASELVPGPGLRTNNRNDSTYDGSVDGWARAAPFLAWATTRFAGDPGGADRIAAWLLARGTQWPRASAWREALWLDDALLAAPAAEAVLPASRFFRGHDLANFRAGTLAGPEAGWALFSLAAGPLTMAEHDQTDKGSFTFYALGEDFAIDSGYAQGDAKSDSTAAHNYLLVDGAGQVGPWGSSARMVSCFLASSLDAAHADLSRTYVHYGQWLRQDPAKPWPVRRAERFAALLRYPDRAPVAVVADAFDKDGAPHRYEWLLHTQVGNTATVGPEGAAVTGARTGARLAVHLAADGPVEWRRDDWAPREGPAHPRLVASVRAADPRFLAVLVPEAKDEAAPREVTRSEGPGFLACAIAHAGGRDLVVAAAGGEVRAGDVATDACLAIVRLDAAGAVAGWLALDGSVLKHAGKTLFRVTAPKGVRGSGCFSGTLAVAAPEAEAFEAFAPGAMKFRSGEIDLPLVPGDAIARWKGARPLSQTRPPDLSSLRLDFTDTATPHLFVLPLEGTGYTRVVDGALCCPGLRREWVSLTHRNFNRNPFQMSGPPRADVFAWPRLLFDRHHAVLGTLTVVSAEPGARLRIGALVRDRSYPDDEVDQDLLFVDVEPESGRFALGIRRQGVEETLHTGRTSLPRGMAQAFHLLVMPGAASVFEIPGKVRLRGSAGGAPPEGYVQFEVSPGLHLHLDDLVIH